MKQIHATTVHLTGLGVMLCGPSASGKSDLGLRLIETGALLVADDRTNLTLSSNALSASAPKEIFGKLEVRGIGIITLEAIAETRLALVIDLMNGDDIERLPKLETIAILGVTVPLIRLCAFEASAPAKVQAALMHHSQLATQ
jgi:HPr kinase/phosphorylase